MNRTGTALADTAVSADFDIYSEEFETLLNEMFATCAVKRLEEAATAKMRREVAMRFERVLSAESAAAGRYAAR